MVSRGRLLVVATPIGNLGDLTERAARCLRDADLVVAEDTRRARALLSHLGIKGKRVERLDAEMEARGVDKWIARLERGEQLALSSDAGCPTVSDPGAVLVRAAVERGIEVSPVPGPSAVLAAVAASGFGGDRFRFFGFLPRKGKARREALGTVFASPETVVIFESPNRLARTLADLADPMPQRAALVARELSKAHEQLVRGALVELAAREDRWRGEITVVLAPFSSGAEARLPDSEIDRRIDALRAAGCSSKQIATALSFDSGWKAREIYRRVVAGPSAVG